MRLSAEIETKKTKAQARSHGSLAERFGRYVYLSKGSSKSNGDCWKWMGARNDRGYGVIGQGARKQGISKAHRTAYELFYFTKLTKGQCICHSCDNPACVNPQHLFLGTQADNIADMIAKGRNVLPPIRKGEQCNFAKLTNKQIRQIRKLAKDGFSSRKLARRFEVSKTTILQIVKRKSWRHV